MVRGKGDIMEKGDKWTSDDGTEYIVVDITTNSDGSILAYESIGTPIISQEVINE